MLVPSLLFLVAFLASGNSLPENGECFVEGQCEGNLMETLLASEKEECLNSCKKNENCKGFTFYQKLKRDNSSLCTLWSTCDEFVGQEGLSGVRNCRQSNSFCWRSSQCQGEPVQFSLDVEDDDGCLELCKGNEECKYFTFSFKSKICTLLKNCKVRKNGHCYGKCVSGQASCDKGTKKGRFGLGNAKLMVGFATDPREDEDQRMMIVNFDGSECQDLPEYPLKVRNAAGSLVNGKPTICGGRHITEEKKVTEKCFQLINSTWEEIHYLSPGRQYASAVTVKRDNNQSDLFYIHGGTTSFGALNGQPTMVFDQDKGWWNNTVGGNTFPDISRHCMVVLNDLTLMVIGGWVGGITASTDTWFHDLQTQTWIPGPSLNRGRSSHSCGVIRDTNYRGTGESKSVVVVAGGINFQGIAEDHTEILSFPGDFRATTFQRLTWEHGPTLPKPNAGGVIVENAAKDALFLIGGHDWNFVPSKKILRLIFPELDEFMEDPTTSIIDSRKGFEVAYAWEEVEAELPFGTGHVAFMVPDSIVDCKSEEKQEAKETV